MLRGRGRTRKLGIRNISAPALFSFGGRLWMGTIDLDHRLRRLPCQACEETSLACIAGAALMVTGLLLSALATTSVLINSAVAADRVQPR